MKNSIIILAIGLMFSVTVKAQTTNKHEIRIGYSDASAVKFAADFGSGLANGIAAAITGTSPDVVKDKKLGMFGLGYRYQITDRLKAGADFGYLKIDKTYSPAGSSSANAASDLKRVEHIVIAMPVAEFSYIKTDLLNFYGSAAAGASFDSSTESKNGKTAKDHVFGFAYQVNPVGLRVGKKLAGFAELGFGHKGIVSAGISYGW